MNAVVRSPMSGAPPSHALIVARYRRITAATIAKNTSHTIGLALIAATGTATTCVAAPIGFAIVLKVSAGRARTPVTFFAPSVARTVDDDADQAGP